MWIERKKNRAVDPHSFFANPDPDVFLNADPDVDPDPEPILQKIVKKLPVTNKVLKKTRKIPHKLKIRELVHIYFILLNKSTIITGTNFLAFFPSKFTPWIRIRI